MMENLLQRIDQLPYEVRYLLITLLIILVSCSPVTTDASTSTKEPTGPTETPTGILNLEPPGPQGMIPDHTGRVNAWEKEPLPPIELDCVDQGNYFIHKYSHNGVELVFEYALRPGETVRLVQSEDKVYRLVVEDESFDVVMYISANPQTEEEE